MKKYDIKYSGLRVHEEPDGEWVRYEDAVAEAARLARVQAAAKASHAELEALRARVTRAVAVLATPGAWSEFAQRALKELRGG